MRPRLALATPLFGTDFMSKYNVGIKFQHNIPRVTILEDEVPILEKYGRSMAMFVKAKPKPVLAQPEVWVQPMYRIIFRTSLLKISLNYMNLIRNQNLIMES